MTTRVFAHGRRSVRLAAFFLLLAGATVLTLAERARASRQILFERETQEEVRGGLGGQPLRDSAAWLRFEAQRGERIAQLERSQRVATWILIPLLLAAGYVARRLFRPSTGSRAKG
jgi:hypothetical protein